MAKYTPVMNEPVRSCYGLQKRSDAYKPEKLNQSFSKTTETPQMVKPFVTMVNPITKGDRTAGHGRYEKGRMNKSRS